MSLAAGVLKDPTPDSEGHRSARGVGSHKTVDPKSTAS